MVGNSNKAVENVRRAYMKDCRSCDKTLRDSCFYKTGKETRCKECVSKVRQKHYNENKEIVLARVRKYRTENPEKIRDTKLRQAYGVGKEYFDAKLKEQGGVCAGCRRNRKFKWRGKEVEMPLDHDHKTKDPRGVLCNKCNRALGLVEESVETLTNLIEYIHKYKK